MSKEPRASRTTLSGRTRIRPGGLGVGTPSCSRHGENGKKTLSQEFWTGIANSASLKKWAYHTLTAVTNQYVHWTLALAPSWSGHSRMSAFSLLSFPDLGGLGLDATASTSSARETHGKHVRSSLHALQQAERTRGHNEGRGNARCQGPVYSRSCQRSIQAEVEEWSAPTGNRWMSSRQFLNQVTSLLSPVACIQTPE